jgi:hypothetical protein
MILDIQSVSCARRRRGCSCGDYFRRLPEVRKTYEENYEYLHQVAGNRSSCFQKFEDTALAVAKGWTPVGSCSESNQFKARRSGATRGVALEIEQFHQTPLELVTRIV